MKRFALVLLALGLIAANDAATFAAGVIQGCPGKCPLCP